MTTQFGFSIKSAIFLLTTHGLWDILRTMKHRLVQLIAWLLVWLVVHVLFEGEVESQSKRQPMRYRNAGSMWDRQTEPNRFWPQRWSSGRRLRRVPPLQNKRQLSRRRRSNGVRLLRAKKRKRNTRRRKKSSR